MRVCIIGGGASGLTTAKHLREEGIEVEILEKRDGLGGLWYFDSEVSSVSDSTCASTSKTYLQFSDFPMDKEVAYFPHHSDYLDYLKQYAEFHNLLPLIKTNHEVIRLEKKEDHWEITIRHGEKTYTDTFDAVAICSGLHHIPLMPEFPGSQNFDGLIIHSSLLDSAKRLKGKRVVLVGGGESAVDLAHDLVSNSITNKIYLSLRKGFTVTLLWGAKNLPNDYDSTRAKVWLPRNFLHDYNRRDQDSVFKLFYTLLGLPFFLVMLPIAFKKAISLIGNVFKWQTWAVFFKAQQRHGNASGIELSQACQKICATPPQSEEEIENRFWQVKNALDWYSGAMHNSQPFIKRSDFLKDIAKQQIKVAPSISRYHGGREIEFEDGSKIEADVVVMCTGFQSVLSFMKEQHLDGRQLYKHVFFPGEPTLAFIGFTRPNVGASPPVSEMQARWFTGILTGRIKLPDANKMSQVVEADAQCYTQNRKQQVKRLTSLIDYHLYMEELAGFVGCRPQLWRLWLKPRLWYIFYFGPMASYQYRMSGHGANPKIALERAAKIPTLPLERVLQHVVLYFMMKPWFSLLGRLGLRKFRPLL